MSMDSTPSKDIQILCQLRHFSKVLSLRRSFDNEVDLGGGEVEL